MCVYVCVCVCVCVFVHCVMLKHFPSNCSSSPGLRALIGSDVTSGYVLSHLLFLYSFKNIVFLILKIMLRGVALGGGENLKSRPQTK